MKIPVLSSSISFSLKRLIICLQLRMRDCTPKQTWPISFCCSSVCDHWTVPGIFCVLWHCSDALFLIMAAPIGVTLDHCRVPRFLLLLSPLRIPKVASIQGPKGRSKPSLGQARRVRRRARKGSSTKPGYDE